MGLLAGVVLMGAIPRTARAADAAFSSQVDLEALRLVAVQHRGRYKTFDTLARETVSLITGSAYFERHVPGASEPIRQDPVFTYLDLIFSFDSYRQERLIYVKKKPDRHDLTRAVAGKVDRAVLDAILDDGLVAPVFLARPEVQREIQSMRSDIVRSKGIEEVLGAASWVHPDALLGAMRIIAPPQGKDVHEPWHALAELDPPSMPRDNAHAGLAAAPPIPGMAPDQQQKLTDLWAAARTAWRSGDAAAASAALNGLAAELPTIAPQIYPQPSKLALEHWYYRYHKMTWVWWFYMVAVVFLLMGTVYQWRRARIIGVSLFALAFCLHTSATGIRWYLAGRIPNSNMFEAVTAAAWLGASVSILFELGAKLFHRPGAWRMAWVLAVGGLVGFVGSPLIQGVAITDWQAWGAITRVCLIAMAVGIGMLITLTIGRRRGAGQGLALLGASVAAMVALMCGRYMEVSLNSNIGQTMPILNDLWLYIHTNMIISSYALIGIAFVTAGMYVVGRLLTAPSASLWLSMLIPAVILPLPAVASILANPTRPVIPLTMVIPAWAPFLIVIGATVLLSAVRAIGGQRVAARASAVWAGPGLAMAAVGGGGATTSLGHFGSSSAGRSRRGEGLGRVLDGATMLLLELSFITLWVGIIMGAKWADHSWGRPWGWDPKEVFALNTWIIFLILVHVRLKVKDKALWTAVLAVIGCSVMLFNWIVVNFFISGLHSYA